ncbi:relaxase/mobilization nuclease domain-containing protein [Pedobacter sp. P351]|uniref:relaxase/mobilization nuclease domain-containing protein n=1 Tax=Pedobacter superstes TaxID=3133441 RepID=UPI0030A11F18
MIVKILSKSASFNGVKYNTSKVDKDKGELLSVRNFGPLQALDNLRPQDYINYLKAVSAGNKNVKYPQLHAVISCKGKEMTKEKLAELAEQWLKGMGYGNNPYLLVFHKDTKNNHIHMVSTRIGKDGKKISDSFEKIRSYEVLNRILQTDEKLEVARKIEKALDYQFSTRAQFMMILESHGYKLVSSGDHYQVCKYGKEQGNIKFGEIDKRIASYQKDKERIAQLRAIIEKYKHQYDPSLYLKPDSGAGMAKGKGSDYSSKLAEVLSDKFGLQILFHGKEVLPPYGYSILDHAKKIVFKGGDIMPLADFIRKDESSLSLSGRQPISFPADIGNDAKPSGHFMAEGTETLKDVPEGKAREGFSLFDFLPDLNISGDVDDEAVHGRKRRRNRKR